MTKPIGLFLAVLVGACGSSGGTAKIDAAPGGGDGGHADAAVTADAPPGTIDGGGTVGGPHPFGTHGGYTAGTLFPSNHSQADLDAATRSYYDIWKATYLEAACNAGEYRVKTTPATSAYTVSEGHGYGMLIAVLMDGYDPNAHAIFDGLYHYYDGHRSTNDPMLMAWAQDASCANVMGADSATDGDLDIAYSLLLADREWGSAGAIDYHARGTAMIAAILASDVHPMNSILVGDWAGAGDSHYTGTRPSDFMLGHFRAFATASGVARWSSVADHTYAVIDYLQTQYAAATGLLPDFAVNATGTTPMPAPGNWLEGADDGRYAYNACRTPWRIATDWLMAGDPRAQTAVRRMNAWIRAKTGDDPTKIIDGYSLAGGATGGGPSLAFSAPFAVSAMVEPVSGTNAPWLNALWDDMVGQGTSEYYGDSIKMLAMIVVSGNWYTP